MLTLSEGGPQHVRKLLSDGSEPIKTAYMSHNQRYLPTVRCLEFEVSVTDRRRAERPHRTADMSAKRMDRNLKLGKNIETRLQPNRCQCTVTCDLHCSTTSIVWRRARICNLPHVQRLFPPRCLAIGCGQLRRGEGVGRNSVQHTSTPPRPNDR